MLRLTLLLALASAAPAQAGVVINELLPDPAGGDGGNEWIELYNPTGGAVDLSGWTLQRAKTTWGTRHTFASGTILPAGGYLLVGESLVLGADLTLADGALDFGNATSNGDAVRLADAGGVLVDVVVYGPNNTDALTDESGAVATSLAPKPSSGMSLARIPNGVDTDRSADDFQTGAPTPRAANPTPVVCDTTGLRVVINELLPDPDGTDGTAGLEFVELYNSGSAPASLADWTLRTATSSGSSASVRWTFSSTAAISPGSYYVVGDSNVSFVNAGPAPGDSLALPNGTGADAVTLVDCAGRVLDTVIYGTDNSSDLLIDDSGAVATSLAPKAGSGQALARKVDGADTNRSGDDFTITNEPSPGFPNPEPPPCTPSAGDVVLNEVLPDPGGTDSDAATEFVELYNRGAAAIDVSGWMIVTAGQPDDWTPDIALPGGSVIAPGDWFVVGGANLPEADVVADLAIPNGSGGDAIRFLDCEGTLVDVVIYGDTNDDGLTDERGAIGEPTVKPGSDQVIARVEDGVDTNSRDDWFLDLSPTPGATNYQEHYTGDTSDPIATGCGGGQAPGSDAPDGSGCRTAPVRAPWLALLALVALRRRR